MPWLIAIVGLLAYEGWALATGRKTLSRMVWNATQGWGLLPWLVGVGCGSLATHFWWHWCP